MRLPAMLDTLRAQQGLRLEIVVADGGSADATVAVAQAAGATVVHAARGRAAQMNAGRRAARAPFLLFLHADSRIESSVLLRDALRALRRVGRGDARVAGHFPLIFERTGPGHERLFRYMEGKTRLNRPYTINGDQGLLIGADWFDRLGGYDESLPFMEDQRLAARIFSGGRWLLLPGQLRTSARRFEREGHYQRYLLMGLMMSMEAAGARQFFARAPAIYRQQAQAEGAPLWPYARLAGQELLRGGPAASLRLGRFLLDNAWQLRLILDVLLRR